MEEVVGAAAAVGEGAAAAPGHVCSRRVYRHTWPIRIMHWVNVIALSIMFFSGLPIFNAHPSLSWGLDDQPLPINNGAPLRLRVSRQLGYKQAKYIARIERVDSFEHIAGGKGGYREDYGYAWYAGI